MPQATRGRRVTFLMNRFSLIFTFLLLLSRWAGAQAPCVGSPPSPQASFRFYDVETKRELTGQALCVGRPIRVVDVSTPRHQPDQLFYKWLPTVSCRDFLPGDTASFFTPTSVGQLVVSININNNQAGGGGGSGLIVAYPAFDVRGTPPPTFTARACGPGVVEVTITDRNYAQYTVQADAQPVVAGTSGRAQQLPAPASGSVTVTVTGYTESRVCSAVATQTLAVAPAYQAPALRRLSLADGPAQFTFDGLQDAYQYQLQIRASGGYRTIANVPNTSPTYVLSTAASGCFRLLLVNACQPNAATPASNELCTVALTATAQNNQNLLTWTTAQTDAPFEVVRDGQVLAQLPAGSTQYVDVAVACGTTYAYSVRALSAGVSESRPVSVRAESSTPPPVPALLASYNLRNQVVLSVGNPGEGRYFFARNGTALAPPSPAATLVDSTTAPDPAAPACYSARGENNCDVSSGASAPVCPPVLTAAAADDAGNVIRLTWTALGAPDPAAPVAYRLLTLAPDNTVLSAQPVTFPTALDQQPPADQPTVRYRLEARGGGLPGVSYSNVAAVTRRLTLVLPNAFTPNGDGQNDVLEIKGRFLDKFLFVVVDRNGQEVFRATDRGQTWDGRIGSNPPVPAAYVWRFEAVDASGQRVVRHGTVTVLR